MLKTKGLIDIKKLENLELSMKSEIFSKFIYDFIIDIESIIQDIMITIEEDPDKFMNLTNLLKSKCSEIGANVLLKSVIKLQNMHLENNKLKMFNCMIDLLNVSRNSLDCIREMLLIKYCLDYFYRKESNLVK